MKTKAKNVIVPMEEWDVLHDMLAKHRQDRGELKTQLTQYERTVEGLTAQLAASRNYTNSNIEEVERLEKRLRGANDTILGLNIEVRETREESKLRHDKFVSEQTTNRMLSELNREQSNTINALRSLLAKARSMVTVALQEE